MFLPLSLTSNLQGRAEPGGSWAAALGLGFGPFAVTAIAAAGVEPFITCHLFGRQLLRLPLSPWLARKSKGVPSGADPAHKAPGVARSRTEQSVARLFRALDPLEVALSLWHNDHILQVRSLNVELQYSFRDVALTGRILAGLYMLTAVLPEHWRINQAPSWESEDRVAVTADAQFRIWPVRLTLDVLRFVLKQRAKARHGAAPASG